jgi:hypothetical protein
VPGPSGFDFEVRGTTVVVTHHRRQAAVLRGEAARGFLREVEQGDPQELMARVTGNYKRGNERMGKDHPRNRKGSRE